MTLQMTMTFGDIVVTAGTIVAIMIAYHAIKASLTTISGNLVSLTERVDGHESTLIDHGEALAGLDASVFGRRRRDKEDRKRRTIEGGI